MLKPIWKSGKLSREVRACVPCRRSVRAVHMLCARSGCGALPCVACVMRIPRVVVVVAASCRARRHALGGACRTRAAAHTASLACALPARVRAACPRAPQAFKAVAKKATDRVLAGLPPPGAPDAPADSAAGATAYLHEARRAKIRALVTSYVSKYGHL